MRLVTASRMKTHVKDMIADLNWMKFELMVAYDKIMLLNRIIASASAPYTMMILMAARHQTRYAVRERELRIAWRPKLSRRGGKSFIVTSVKLYNQIKLLGKVMTKKAMSKFVKLELKNWKKL